MGCKTCLHHTLLTTLFLGLLLDRTFCQVPIQLLREIGTVKSGSYFIDNYIVKAGATNGSISGNPLNGTLPPTTPDPMERILFTAQGSINPEGREIVAGMLSIKAMCEPTMKAVRIPTDSDPNVILYPDCTKMQRCGGCCGPDILECVPSKIMMETKQVMKARYNKAGATKFEYIKMIGMPMEKHLACECRCKVQKHHCDRILHEYVPASCRCRCKNEADATTCPPEMKWSEKQCKCLCREIKDCDSDEVYNNDTCSCGKREKTTTSRPTEKPTAASQPINPCLGVKCPAGHEQKVYGARCKCVLSQRWGMDTAPAKVPSRGGMVPRAPPIIRNGPLVPMVLPQKLAQEARRVSPKFKKAHERGIFRGVLVPED